MESVIRYGNALLTVPSLLEDYYGVSGICLSVASIVNREGVATVMKIQLGKKEIKGFQESARIIKEVLKSLKI